jgi:asparagine synthase (glutamine-hydrolysing)
MPSSPQDAAPGARGAYRPLDLAVGWLLGWDARPPLPAPEPGVTPRDVLERALEPALAAGPVGVAMLGGTSSAIALAVAAAVARRDGYELPIPLSLTLSGEQMRDDAAYQERVVDHLGLRARWERIDAEAELGLLGPQASAVLTAHGPQYPANVHWVRPLLRRLGGGTFVVAHGRGEVFDWWPYGPLWEALRSRRRPSRRVLALATRASLPPAGRVALARARRYEPLPWLTPEAQRRHRRALAEMQPAVRWRTAFPQLRSQRCQVEIPRSYARVAAEFGVEISMPWLSPEIGAALLAHSTDAGYADTEAGRRFFGDLLPSGLPLQRDRVAYGALYYGEQTRAFARSWSGAGLDEQLTDPAVLRALWSSDRHDWRTSALLQTAWLHDRA